MKKKLVAGVMAVVALCLCGMARGQAAGQTSAQTEKVPEWVTAAGGKAEFEAASVREDLSGKYVGPPYSIDSDDDFTKGSGLFTAVAPLTICSGGAVLRM